MKEPIQLSFRILDEEHKKKVMESIIKIKQELEEEFGKDGYVIISCHLSQKILEERNLDRTIIDFLTNTFQNNYFNFTNSAKNFDDAMANLSKYREFASQLASRMYIIGEDLAPGIAKELELFTMKEVRVV